MSAKNLNASTRGLAKMEVTTSQRNDLAIGRVIAGFCVEFARIVRAQALLEMLQQEGFLVSWADNEDRFTA